MQAWIRTSAVAGVVVGLAVLAACSKKSDSAGAPGTEPSSAAAPATPAAAPTGGGSGGWLDGIPAKFPKFEQGTFSAESRRDELGSGRVIYSLYYEGVPKPYLEEYFGRLEAAGLSVQRESAGHDGVSAYGEWKEGDVKRAGYSVSWQSNGHVDFTITQDPPGTP